MVNMAFQPARERVYRFPLATDNGFVGTSDPDDNAGQPITPIGYAMAIGAPLLTIVLVCVFGALAGMDTLTTVPAGWVVLMWFLALVFYLLFDLPWFMGAERFINDIYYKYHGTDKILNGGPGRIPLMLAFFPLAATSNLFLVILPSIEHPGRHYSYYVTAFRGLINGMWCYGTLGVIQGITFPRWPLETSGLVWLSGALLSTFTSLTVVGISQAIDVLNVTNSTA